MNYYMHEKLAAVQEHSQAIGEFLEWMEDQGITRCRWTKTDWGGEYMIDYRKIDDLLAEYFEIDTKRLEEEKRDMLRRLRAGTVTLGEEG